ncbi:O-antigen ligase family protein [Aquisphaera insulae]|uniref:O-antigen ligase family protein n=1 Tax=Aquisphaera insulae TaxID=2712864 RepID=UPI0013E9D7D7|nr:O-antigen ligase family protein [Aquisphaera insulae]
MSLAALVLAAWIPISLCLYGKLGPTRGALISLLAGWILLPNEAYPVEALELATSQNRFVVHSLALAADPLWNKASAIGLGCLLGIVLFDAESLRRLRFLALDGAFLLFAAIPILSAWSNGLPIAGGLAQARHLILAWGVPYLVGRTRFASPEALLEMEKAWAIAGLVTAPAALLEFATGPVFYDWVYGQNPYRADGISRTLGHRPLLFMEQGNQWGMWAASTALAAAWLWAGGERDLARVGQLRIPTRRAAIILVVVAILGQSHSSLGWLACGLAWIAAIRLRIPKRAIRAAIAAGAVLVVLAAAILVVRSGGPGALRNNVRGFFVGLGKTSFTWRLARVAEHLEAIRERPILGHGLADWSPMTPDGRFIAPVSIAYPLMEAGFHGVIAALASMAVLAAPIVLAARRLARSGRANAAVAAAVAILAINLADLFLNSCLLPPILVAAGGLTAWSTSEPE